MFWATRMLMAIAFTCCGVLWPSHSFAQDKTIKSQIIGAWEFVSGDVAWGQNPKGLMTFLENGYFTWQVFRSDRPKFADRNRQQATPEESLSATRSSLAYYGTYTVDEAERTVTTKIIASTFPNSEGFEDKRLITRLTADELAYTNPTNTSGNAVNAVWRRAK